MAENVKKAVETAIVNTMHQVEQNLDEEINRLNSLQDDDLEAIRMRRLAQMKKQAEDHALWRRNGHGSVHHISEKEFFARAKGPLRMVAIFYRKGSSRYANDFVDHISRIAQSHLETLFVTLDAEKSPFLCTRLNIRILPSIVMVKNGEIDKMLPGLDQLCSTGDLRTSDIEKRLYDFGMLTDTTIGDNGQ